MKRASSFVYSLQLIIQGNSHSSLNPYISTLTTSSFQISRHAERSASMSKRLRERVQVGIDPSGKPVYKWATGYTTTELQIDIARILVEEGVLDGVSLL